MKPSTKYRDTNRHFQPTDDPNRCYQLWKGFDSGVRDIIRFDRDPESGEWSHTFMGQLRTRRRWVTPNGINPKRVIDWKLSTSQRGFVDFFRSDVRAFRFYCETL